MFVFGWLVFVFGVCVIFWGGGVGWGVGLILSFALFSSIILFIIASFVLFCFGLVFFYHEAKLVVIRDLY